MKNEKVATTDAITTETVVKVLKSQSTILEIIATIKVKIAKEREKRGKGRLAKGRVDNHLKMDTDLKMIEKALN